MHLDNMRRIWFLIRSPVLFIFLARNENHGLYAWSHHLQMQLCILENKNWWIPRKSAETVRLRKIFLTRKLTPLSTNPTKLSNILKQFVGKLPTNCWSVLDHFVILALKGLSKKSCILRGDIFCRNSDCNKIDHGSSAGPSIANSYYWVIWWWVAVLFK